MNQQTRDEFITFLWDKQKDMYKRPESELKRYEEELRNVVNNMTVEKIKAETLYKEFIVCKRKTLLKKIKDGDNIKES